MITARTLSSPLTRLAVAGALLGASYTASAANVQGSAWIDWSQLSVTLASPTLTMSDGFQSSNVFAFASPGTSSADSASDWTSSRSVNVGTLGQNAAATVDAHQMAASAGLNTIPGPTAGTLSAEGRANREGDIQILGSSSSTGVLLISAPVLLSLSITDIHAGDTGLFGQVSASLSLVKTSGSSTGFARGEVVLQHGEDAFDKSVDDLAIVVVAVKGGDLVHLSSLAVVDVRGANAVPVPASLWLLAPALAGIGALRRRTTT